MIADFVSGTSPHGSLSAMLVIRLVHFGGYDFSELERRTTGRIRFESMVCFDNFDIDASRMLIQCLRGSFDQIHGEVDGQAHAWGPANRNRFCS